jgi:hypothetical protein
LKKNNSYLQQVATAAKPSVLNLSQLKRESAKSITTSQHQALLVNPSIFINEISNQHNGHN